MRVAGYMRQQAHDQTVEALHASNILIRACGICERVRLRQMRCALSIWADVVAAEAKSELTRRFEKRTKLAAHVSSAKCMVMWARRKQTRTLSYALRRWHRYVVLQKEAESTARLQQIALMSFRRLLETRNCSKLMCSFAQWRDCVHDARQMQRQLELQDQELKRRRLLALTVVVERIGYTSKRRAFRQWSKHTMRVAGYMRQQAHDQTVEALHASNILIRACGICERVRLRQMRCALSIWADVVAAEAKSELTRRFEKRTKLAAHVSSAKCMVMWARRKQTRTLSYALRRWHRYVVLQKEAESTARLQQIALMSFRRLLVRADRQQQLQQTKLAWKMWHSVVLTQQHRKLRCAEQHRRLRNVSV